MNVLLVAYWFPPANTMGAIRMGKLAKYLHEAGHDIRVLTTHTPEDPSLPVEVPEDRVIWTPYWEVDRIFDPLTGAARRAARILGLGRHKDNVTVEPGAGPSVSRPPVVPGLRRHYYAMIQVPDSHIGWRRYAVSAGRRLLATWRPDIIVASAPPFTCLVIARKLGREFNVPWVAEFRDIWVDNPYNTDPIWRQRIDRHIERAVLKNADGIVTVTPVWSDVLARQYGLKVATILNGYAEEDVVPPPPSRRSNTVSVVYTGAIYPGYRDPSPLFAAIALLGQERERIEIVFYGPEEGDLRPLAARYGVGDRIVVRPRVNHGGSLKIQAAADVLLLLQWNDVKDEGNIPGKFFEYLGARRPILMLGYEQGIMAQMIRQRGAGVVCNEPREIAKQLSRWIAQRPTGIPTLDASVAKGLSRTEHYRTYENLLEGIVARRQQRGGQPAPTEGERSRSRTTSSTR